MELHNVFIGLAAKVSRRSGRVYVHESTKNKGPRAVSRSR